MHVAHLLSKTSEVTKNDSCDWNLQRNVSCDVKQNMKGPRASAVTFNKIEQNMEGPPARTGALSTSGRNMKGPPAGRKAYQQEDIGSIVYVKKRRKHGLRVRTSTGCSLTARCTRVSD